MSALPPKADMCSATRYVRFVPEADIGSVSDQLAFLAQAAFESDVFARWCTVKRGRTGNDCENERGRKSKTDQEQLRRLFWSGGFGHPVRLPDPR
jgi:hypothetical protein